MYIRIKKINKCTYIFCREFDAVRVVFCKLHVREACKWLRPTPEYQSTANQRTHVYIMTKQMAIIIEL